MGTYPAKKTPEQYEAACVAAYHLRCDGMVYEDIAAELAGPPHFCGGKSTAVRWVRDGLAVVASSTDEDGKTVRDPMRKRRARREMALDALDALRVKMDQDLEAGVLAKREAYYKLQRLYILDGITIAGAQAPRALPRVKRADGSKTAATPLELLGSLAAMQSEVDALIDRTLPDGRTDP